MLTGSKPGKWVTRHSARGLPYPEWEPDMPRLKDNILDCVLYLYGSKAEAMAGDNAGGSGFLLSIEAETLPHPAGFHYAVTNRHVIAKGFTTVRLNTIGGLSDAFEFRKDQWICSETDDLAIISLPEIIFAFRTNAIPRKCLVSEQFVIDHGVGPGDELLMLGRFVNRDGTQTNTPTARFGNLAQMPGEPLKVTIENKDHYQECFLAEVRSIGGFSGSPVFLIPNTAYQRPGKPLPSDRGNLLGIDFCHVVDWVPARDQSGERPDIRVPINTGMAGVIPAWKLENLLNSDRARNARENAEAAETARRKLPTAQADSSGPLAPATKDANPEHREDFTSLLGAAARKQQQGG